MKRKKLTKKQEKFRCACLEDLKTELQWSNDCINMRIDFPDKNRFHLHVIEDYCSHLHVRGELENGEVFSINKVSSCVTKDLFFQVLEFLKNYE